jgi:hypothetical protein
MIKIVCKKMSIWGKKTPKNDLNVKLTLKKA